MVVLWHLDMVQVARLHMREVRVLYLDPGGAMSSLFLGVSDQQLFQHIDQCRVVVRLANQGVHQTGKVHFSRGKHRGLIILVILEEGQQQRVIEQKGDVALID